MASTKYKGPLSECSRNYNTEEKHYYQQNACPNTILTLMRLFYVKMLRFLNKKNKNRWAFLPVKSNFSIWLIVTPFRKRGIHSYA
jgi:hypothetical protein